jgi:hypothetical protein
MTLAEGCFAGPITVPAMWSKTKVERSKADGDWASVWCQSHALPSPIHAYGESFTEADFANCGKLSFQGKGSIHLSALDLKKGGNMIHPIFPEAPPQNVPGGGTDQAPNPKPDDTTDQGTLQHLDTYKKKYPICNPDRIARRVTCLEVEGHMLRTFK